MINDFFAKKTDPTKVKSLFENTMDKVFFNIFIILIETMQTFFLPLNIIRLYKNFFIVL